MYRYKCICTDIGLIHADIGGYILDINRYAQICTDMDLYAQICTDIDGKKFTSHDI